MPRHDNQGSIRTGAGDGGAKDPPLEDLFSLDEGPMRRELIRQIAVLEHDLAQLPPEMRPYQRVAPPPSRGPGVLSTEELEHVRDELIATIATRRQRVVDRATERLNRTLAQALDEAPWRARLARSLPRLRRPR